MFLLTFRYIDKNTHTPIFIQCKIYITGKFFSSFTHKNKSIHFFRIYLFQTVIYLLFLQRWTDTESMSEGSASTELVQPVILKDPRINPTNTTNNPYLMLFIIYSPIYYVLMIKPAKV